MKKILFFALFILYVSKTFASIAVLPYRDQAFDSRISGKEYARMISLGISLMKDAEVLSPEEADIGMKQLGINPEGSVDAADLNAFGIKYNLDYILLGSISKSKGQFAFDNVLYSVRDRRVLSRNHNSSRDIYRLMQLEINETLIGFGKKKAVTGKTQADIVFLMDTSYNISDEFGDVRKAVSDFSSGMIGRLNVDTRIYLAPYSEKKSYQSVTVHHNSIKEVNSALEGIKPGGSGNLEKFSGVLSYTLKNIKWRTAASKEIYIINNSKLDGMFVPERFALEAKKKDIRLNVISAGRITGEYTDIERLSALTGGLNFSVSYHQRMFDKSGGKHDVYLQRGRIFHSIAPYSDWKKGIVSSTNKNPKYVTPPETLDEVFYSRVTVLPEKLVEIFSQNTGVTVIQKEPLKNNIADIISSMQSSLSKTAGTSYYGRALVSDGKISFWVRIKDQQIMNVFDKHGADGFYFKAGFNIKKSDTDAYGIELVPVTAALSADYIPDLARTTLSDIVKNRDFFISKGLGSPPVWFIDIKIENIERHDRKIDVRD